MAKVFHPQPHEDPDPETVIALLRRQVDLFRHLETLSRRQRELVSSEDTQPLMRLLHRRQTLTKELTELGRTLEPARGRWERFRGRLSFEQNQRVERLLEDSNRLLQKILQADEEDARRLSARKKQAESAAAANAFSKAALQAYGGTTEKETATRVRYES